MVPYAHPPQLTAHVKADRRAVTYADPPRPTTTRLGSREAAARVGTAGFGGWSAVRRHNDAETVLRSRCAVGRGGFGRSGTLGQAR
jgi:hypothetical protein